MSVYGPLVTPDEVIDLLLAVAGHDTVRQEHLHALETAKGLTARTVPDFLTIGRLLDQDAREGQDWSPSLMFYLAGTASVPELNENRHLDFVWNIAAEVEYLGVNRTDAEKGAWWYAMAAAQMLLQRTPRDGIVQRLRVHDMEAMPSARADRVHGVRFIVEAHVADTLALHGPRALGAADLPADPYAPPRSWPTVTRAAATVDKEPVQ